MDENMKEIGESLYGFQSALNMNDSNLEDFIKENYTNKWISDELYNVINIRTTFVNSTCQFLINEGLFNIEKVMLCMLTDPLAHDIEYTPKIKYKGNTYVTTHSMIYNKFLACSNPKIKGIFVDSPNIRLEIESPNNIQRGRYVVDFSQIDIELRRDRNISIDDYYNKQSMVKEVLIEDFNKIKDFFERMLAFAIEGVNKKNKDDLKNLGVVIEVPKTPFPSFLRDESIRQYGSKKLEEKIGENTKSQFFWITGLQRENYDLIYPYLLADNKRIDPLKIKSSDIYNYDIIAKSIDAKTGKHSGALEILSGGIREWLFETIIERIIDNKVLPVRPKIKNGNIENIDELGGYGPFLFVANMKNKEGKPIFPETMGGGIGVERTLYTILRGEKIKKIDDVMFFAKNPDSHPIYLF